MEGVFTRFRLLSDGRPACVVPGCRNEPAAVVHRYYPRKVRPWDRPAPVYACAEHMEDDRLNAQLKYPHWQELLFVERN